MENPKPESGLLDLEEIKPGVPLHGKIVSADDGSRCSILVGDKLLTVEAIQQLLNRFEEYDIRLTFTDPSDR
jgi:hypothetical protein